jgi:hypothetical protein
MNVIRHYYVSPNADAKVGCSSAVFDKRLVHFRLPQQARPGMGVERHKINRRIGSLKN